MFATGHILKISADGRYAAILVKHHINGEQRTARVGNGETFDISDIDCALREAARGCGYTCDDDDNAVVGVRAERYKILRPQWFVTTETLMAQYQRLQRDEDIIIHPELLPYARKIWSEQLKQKVDATKAQEQLKQPMVMCQSSAAEDHEGVPLK